MDDHPVHTIPNHHPTKGMVAQKLLLKSFLKFYIYQHMAATTFYICTMYMIIYKVGILYEVSWNPANGHWNFPLSAKKHA